VKSLLSCLSACALILSCVVAASADEKKPADKKADDVKKPAPYAAVFSFPKTITLTDDQTKKLEALKTEYTPKLEEFKKQLDVLMTPERLKAQKEAMDKAKADGKKGKELNDAGLAALKLSEAETKQLNEVKAAQGKVMGEINKKKAELLTEEQKKALQPKKPTTK
jgi:hypothetical protein